MSKKYLPDGMRVRWLGHATVDVLGPGGQKFIVDPYIVNNPAFPKALGAEVTASGAYHAILVTHPHSDHFEDVLPLLLDDPELKVVTQFEIGQWLTEHKVKQSQVVGMNTGGTLNVHNMRITMVPAVHTSSIVEEDGQRRVLGFPIGYVVRFENGFTIYFAGDTAVTMEMQIIRNLYKPNLAILPIGDFYTMGAEQAAYALKLLEPDYAIGIHWGTWNGMPPGTPEALEKELAHYKLKTHLIKLKPGESLT